MIKVWKVALLAGLLPLTVAAEPDANLEVADAWIRALPPMQPLTSAYLTLANHGATEVVVIGASSDVAGKVEIHQTREVDGLFSMAQLDKLTVAAGAQVELAPGGTHLMLLDLTRMPAPGEKVRLCLQLESNGELCTEADVRKSAVAQSNPHHSHN